MVQASHRSIWWGADRHVLSRVLADQLFAEMRRLRHAASGGPPPWEWTDVTRLDELSPVAVDSLDIMSLTGAVAELVPDSGLLPGLMKARSFGDWCDSVEQSAMARPPRQVIFRSSGSTAHPKRATHALVDLELEAGALAAIVAGRRRVLSAIPANHIYGFIHSVLLPRHLGRLPVIELRAHAPATLAALLQPGDLVLGHPTYWDCVLRGDLGRFPPDVTGVTSAAPCPAETALALRAMGLARLIQVYGSSETAGVGWRDDPADAYTLLPHWQRQGDGLLRASLKLEPPDHLEWQDQERFLVSRRRDEAVQVGGVNVLPGDVGAALMKHAAVSAVSIRRMRPHEGDRLKAFIVPVVGTPDHRALEADLRRLAASTLLPVERPGAYSFGPSLPCSSFGKLTDWPIDETS